MQLNNIIQQNIIKKLHRRVVNNLLFKNTLLIILLILIVLLVADIFILFTLWNNLINSVQERGIDLAESIASNSESPLATGRCLMPIFKLVDRMNERADIIYIIILDEYYQVVAHSQNLVKYGGKKFIEFDGVEHTNMDTIEVIEFSLQSNQAFYDTPENEIGKSLYDIAAPIRITKNNERLPPIGYVRIGISIEDSINKPFNDTLKYVMFINILGLILASIGSWKLTLYQIKPIKLLENGVEAIKQGDLKHQVEVTSNDELGNLTLAFNEMIGSLREKKRLDEELEIGRQIQMGLLPETGAEVLGMKVCGKQISAKEIGGDYFDFIPKGRNRLITVIGDVAGKGVPAGLIMVMARTIIHSTINYANTKRVIDTLNKVIATEKSRKFMTMIYFSWDNSKKKLFYTAAGHEYILIYRAATKTCEAIRSGGMALGMIPDLSNITEEKTLTLEPEDKVILYTDGVTEAHNEKNMMFGKDSLISIVESYGNEKPEDLLEIIFEKVQNFMGKQEQYDDITAIVMERT